jgi:hypothetical protein
MVNPLWIDESITNQKILPYDIFIVKNSYTDLFLSNTRKRKYNDMNSDTSLPKKMRKTETGKKSNHLDTMNKENVRKTTGSVVRIINVRIFLG